MDIKRARSRVVVDQLELDLTDSEHRAFQNLLDTLTLLRVHNLVIALLQLFIDVDVLYIESAEMLEDLRLTPGVFDLRLVGLRVYYSGFLLQLLDLHQIAHGILPLHVKGNVRHI
jgi:hypothetical protein